ncbi:MAG: HEAT repeat domain-containing protein [Anaerolineaceae bacterium]|nr:HEAT repeat domain-containing protein [Anaerolineaceae bacterium]
MNYQQPSHSAQIAKQRLEQSKHISENETLDSIRSLLPSADAITRLRIVQALDKLGTKAALDILVTLLPDEDQDVQQALRDIFLRRLPRYTKKLHWAVLKGDLAQRVAALNIIATELGPHHVPILGICLRAKQPEIIQEMAAQILQAIQTPTAQEKAASWRQRRFEAEAETRYNQYVQQHATTPHYATPFMSTCGEYQVVNHRQAFANLLNHVREGKWGDQQKAAKAVHRLIRTIQGIPYEDYVAIRQDFIDVLDDSNYVVRWVAVEALARLGDTQTVPALLTRLRDSAWTVRVAAVRALIEIQDVAVVSQLVGMIGDANTNVQEAAVEAIGLLGTVQDVPLLASVVDSNLESMVRLAAIEAIRRLHGEVGAATLLKMLGDPNPTIRWHSAMTLSELADEHYVHEIIDHLEDDSRPRWEDKRVCDWLIDALKRMDHPDAKTAIKRWQSASV